MGLGEIIRSVLACDDWVPDDCGWYRREPRSGEDKCIEVVCFEGCVNTVAAAEFFVESERREE